MIVSSSVQQQRRAFCNRNMAIAMTKETIINCRVTLDAFLVILDQIL